MYETKDKYSFKLLFLTIHILGHPVRGRSGEVIGVIQMLNKKDELHFSEDDVSVLNKYKT